MRRSLDGSYEALFHAVEQVDARVGENLSNLVLLAGLIIVVAEHRDDRDLRSGQLPGEDVGLLGQPVVGQIPAQHQHVGKSRRPVLFSHLILFGFIYPSERDKIPDWVMQLLECWLQAEMSSPPPIERVCLGTILSWDQYQIDIEQRGYQDGRCLPPGEITAEECADMAAILKGDKSTEQRPPTPLADQARATSRSV